MTNNTMNMTADTTTVPAPVDFELAALADSNFSSEELAEDMDGLSLSLRRVKMPAGGALQYEIPTGDPQNPDYARSLVGVILYNHASNAYWPEGKEYDDNEPPLCQSVDGKQGHGDPGGACATCILNQFGSSATGRGKACKNMRILYLLRSGEYMPLQLTLSPTSISPFREFMSQAFVARRRVTYGSLVEIGLKRMNNGNDYSVATFRRLADFSGEQLKQITAYSLGFRDQLRAMNAQRAIVQQELLESECKVEGDVTPAEDGTSFCVTSTVDGDKMPLPA